MTDPLFLSLGTNLGDRLQNLRQAVTALEHEGLLTITAISPVYETPPWGYEAQPAFLNLCLAGRTTLPPAGLLAAVKKLEAQLGRVPGDRWGPRLIDIDILAYAEAVVALEGLTLPHPGLPLRPFVLVPLADIAPRWVHPETGRDVLAMRAAVSSEGIRRWPVPLFWGRRTEVMGILNVTPDSFSGDGVLVGDGAAVVAAAVAQAEAFVAAGADVIDIGGESTRPGSVPVSAEAEMARVLPVIRAVRQAVNVPISVDTYRAEVAEAALEAGADWVNDVWGLRMDPRLAGVVAAAGCPVVVMHNRSQPKDVAQEQRLGGRYVGIHYEDLIGDIRRELQASIDLGLAQGIRPEQIIIDPGLGFGKTVAQNVQLLRDLNQLKSMGFPILIGPSRKSFIGYTLNLPPEDRLEGTAAAVAIGIDRGADIVRVHDVAAMVRVARMTDRIVR